MFDFVHTTREGQSMLIGEMETLHLLRTIRFFLKNIVRFKTTFMASSVDEYSAALYNAKVMKPREVAAQVNRNMQKVTPYLVELLLRHGEVKDNPIMKEIEDALQCLTGRNGRLVLENNSLALLSKIDDEWDGEEDLDDDEAWEGHPGHPSNYGDN